MTEQRQQPLPASDWPPVQAAGESDEAYFKRSMAMIAGEDIRTKTDLKDWTGSLPFHLDVPVQGKKKS